MLKAFERLVIYGISISFPNSTLQLLGEQAVKRLITVNFQLLSRTLKVLEDPT